MELRRRVHVRDTVWDSVRRHVSPQVRGVVDARALSLRHHQNGFLFVTWQAREELER